MRIRHPTAVAGESVDVDGDLVPVEDGEFEIPDDAESWLQRWCNANGFGPDDVVIDEDEPEEPEYCQVVKQDGEICGRELPCQYHS